MKDDKWSWGLKEEATTDNRMLLPFSWQKIYCWYYMVVLRHFYRQRLKCLRSWKLTQPVWRLAFQLKLALATDCVVPSWNVSSWWLNDDDIAIKRIRNLSVSGDLPASLRHRKAPPFSHPRWADHIAMLMMLLACKRLTRTVPGKWWNLPAYGNIENIEL